MIFKKFSKNLRFDKILKVSILYLENVRVLAGLANLARGYDCSNPCSF